MMTAVAEAGERRWYSKRALDVRPRSLRSPIEEADQREEFFRRIRRYGRVEPAPTPREPGG